MSFGLRTLFIWGVRPIEKLEIVQREQLEKCQVYKMAKSFIYGWTFFSLQPYRLCLCRETVPVLPLTFIKCQKKQSGQRYTGWLDILFIWGVHPIEKILHGRTGKKIKKRLKKLLTYKNRHAILNKSLGAGRKEKSLEHLINKGLQRLGH